MPITVTPTGQACGAFVTGVELSLPLSGEQISEIREAWLEHHVLAFPKQELNDDQFERFAACFGEFGEDPFFNPIEGRKYIAAVRREADETNPIFAEGWHSDWSFLPAPPSATMLYSLDIPPEGGDTLFANQHLALKKMPSELRKRLEGKIAVHSAVLAYSPDGIYSDTEKNGAMDIRPSEDAYSRHSHPLFRKHPETGEPGIFGTSFAYIIGFEGLDDEAARPLLDALYHWQAKDEFVYRHKWQNNMLVMWDNRSVLHRASGGYKGHRRELHRITVY